MKRSGIVISIAAVSAAIIILCIFFFGDTDSTDNKPAPDRIQAESEKLILVENNPFIDQMVDQLQKYYGKTISDKSTQASIIGIRDYIIGTHPANGKALFYTILKRAFPDYADDIMETLNKLDQYNQWLEDNKRVLFQMSAEERSAALWKKRRELFGDDAEKIWAGDMLATEARKAKVKDILAVLNDSKDTNIEEKMDMYQRVLRETYENSPEEYILDQTYLLSKVFFSIDSVQDELKQMSPEERRLEINEIRRKMGFSEKQVEETAKRDADNEQRWDVGLKYMQERDKIVQESEEPLREEKLKALREQYFHDEAKTIELEEKDDFFRFKRPRIYGRN